MDAIFMKLFEVSYYEPYIDCRPADRIADNVFQWSEILDVYDLDNSEICSSLGLTLTYLT